MPFSQRGQQDAIAAALDSTPWLQEAASSSRSQSGQVLAKKHVVEAGSAAQHAVAKMRANGAEKEAKAAEKWQDLVRPAAIEYLTQDYGKGTKQKPCPESVKERLVRRAAASSLWPPACTRTSAISILCTCGR